MKKTLKSMLAVMAMFAVVATGCKKEEATTNNNNNNTGITISQTQKATAFYFGGTWCPPCGANGKPAKEAMKNQVGTKVDIISCQLNGGTADPMNNVDANALAILFNVTGVPAMHIGGNGSPFQTIPSNSSMSANSVNAVNATATKTAVTNCVLTLSENSGIITAKVNGKFFEAGTGEFYLAGYLTEGKLTHTQSSDASVEKNVHYDVLREKFGSSVTGELIKADPAKDFTYEKELTFFIDAAKYKKENCKIVAVIWQKTATGWVVSNSTSVKLQ